ncbi:MAG: protein-L-isoaspartate(D-aspartate) O-methyltransferase [Candidatus Chaera renei]|uniref:Protein-L-isoaspartate O-methyltransferase n=1 Tax=Candidatus Chaera renei TaxID=2506947 RepID=A0A4Q0AFR6_9BACT|nr:MAG: protein-L-isoaspartate(D-aspartate) O-methyltransferase [Candidatus Chaera renei]
MTNRQLVKHLKNSGALSDERLEAAFEAVDRIDFVPEAEKLHAYEDRPLHIGWEQTVSSPMVVAFMLELLDVRPGQRVMEVGSGSGWVTALLACLSGKDGQVYGVERLPQLLAQAERNLARYDFKQIELLQAGKKLGLPEKAPFERILVSAAAKNLPGSLVKQLAPEGILVIPVGHKILRVVNAHDGPRISEYGSFVFVPLIY